jgi:hypothetical protein
MIPTSRVLPLLVALLCASAAYAANSWEAPSSEMAIQIVAITGPGTISLKITNRSSVPAEEIPAIRKALEKGLRTAGVIVQSKTATSDVHLTLSQNALGFFWVAEVQEGAEVRVAMVQLPGATMHATSGAALQLSLRSSLLYSQSDPILDVALLGSGSDERLLVLEPVHIKTYARTGNTWQLVQSFDIPQDNVLPRDPRGQIAPATDHAFDAYLPGVICVGTTTEAKTLTVSCSNSDDPWPVASQKALYNASRNYFTGVVVPGFGSKLPPFYSAAQLVRAMNTSTLFADVSGQVHLFEAGSHKIVVGARDWGSDIAGVTSDCGSGAKVLASAAGTPASDTLRAYELSGREASAVSTPLTFEGTITAVWPSADGTSVRVVVRNPLESRYEAYSVSVACTR